jgi:hypothetical protein
LKLLERAFDVDTYLRSRDPEIKYSGPNAVVTCPVCQKQKLWTLLQDKKGGPKAGAWQCWRCEESGSSAISLVKRMEDCSTFEAIQKMSTMQVGRKQLVDLRALVLEKLDGVEPEEAWDETPIRKVDLPGELILPDEDHRLPRYIRYERGIGPRRAARYGIGWCERGYFRNRMVVPVVQDRQQLFFVARYMKAKPPAGVKKTVYPKGSQPGRVLFNYDRARRCQTIRIVEGALDAVHLGKSAVATFGTSLSQYQLELLMRSSATEISIIWDRDAVDKARKLAMRLSEFWSVRVVVLPDARDPDEWAVEDLRKLEAESAVLDEYSSFKEFVLSHL